VTQRDAEKQQELSKVLWGAYIWRVRLTIQHGFEEGYSPEDFDELWLDFHEPLAIPEKITKHRRVGYLWMTANVGARLEQGGRILVGSTDSVAKILEQFPKMVGSRLLTTEVRPPGGDTAFIFENDLVLNCFPAQSHEGAAWVVRTDDGN
jgi:hypothetical protein